MQNEQSINEQYASYLQSPTTFFRGADVNKYYELFGPSYYTTLFLTNTTLCTSISVYMACIETTGNSLERTSVKLSKSAEALELKRLKGLVKKINYQESLADLRLKIRKDYEIYGNAFIEIRKDLLGNTEYATLLPTPFVEIHSWYKEMLTVVTEGRSFIQPVLLPVYKIYKHGQSVFYKDIRSKKIVDAQSGQVHNPEVKLNKKIVPASTVCWLLNPDSSFSKGLPRWVSAIPDVVAGSQISQVNREMLENGGIAPWIALVSGGAVTQSNLRRLHQTINRKKSHNEILVLEASSDAASDTFSGGGASSPKIELKSLRGDGVDAMFTNYATMAEDRIRNAFRLPEIFYGNLGNENSDSVKHAVETAEEAVFRPERKMIDQFINTTILGDGVNGNPYFIFESNPLYIANKTDIAEVMNKLAAMGAVTPAVSIDVANQLFDIDIPKNDAFYSNIPFTLLRQVLATKPDNADYSDITGFLGITSSSKEEPNG